MFKVAYSQALLAKTKKNQRLFQRFSNSKVSVLSTLVYNPFGSVHGRPTKVGGYEHFLKKILKIICCSRSTKCKASQEIENNKTTQPITYRRVDGTYENKRYDFYRAYLL